MKTTLQAIVITTLVLVIAMVAWITRSAMIRSGEEMPRLVAAVGANLPFDPRLSAPFPPPARHVRRSDATISLTPDARIAIAQIEKRAEANPTPELLGQLGIAYLVAGEADKSIRVLEDSVAARPDRAALSDLAAAYLVKADRTPARRVELVAHALESASQSLRLRPSDAARFNYALAVEALSSYLGLADPWSEYLRSERDPLWRAAAERHAGAITPPIDARAAWASKKQLLDTALDRDHDSTGEEIVRDFPEAATEFLEREVLVEWARTALAGRDTRHALGRAQRLAAFIARATSDRFTTDAIAALADSTGRSDLARAHLKYADALVANDANRYAQADDLFADAEVGFLRRNSPYRDWTGLHRATILFLQRTLAAADVRLTAIEHDASRRGYTTLRGRTLWVRGLVQAKQWRLTDAIESFTEAGRCFDAAAERENRVALDSVIASNLRTLGEHADGWTYIGRALEDLARERKAIRRYLFLYNASLFASSQNSLESALLFQNAAIAQAVQVGDGPTIEALVARATLYSRRAATVLALDDLREAESRLGRLADGPARKYHQAEINVLRAEIGQHAGSDDGALERSIAFFATAEPAFVPRLYLALARARRSSGSSDDAESAFDAGIAALEAQQARLDDDALRISYFDDGWDLFPEMIAFQLDVRKTPDRAFDYLERSRARALLRDLHPAGLAAVRASLPASSVLLSYTSLRDRVVVWLVTAGGVHMAVSPVGRDEVGRLIARCRADVAQGAPARAALDRLSEILLDPVVRQLPDHATLEIVADDLIQQVPFAALRDRANGAYLIEGHALFVSPSATFAAHVPRAVREGSGIRRGLLVGDPAIGQPLPGAASEVAAIAPLYQEALVLTGRDATRDRFLRSVDRYDVVHFGGHAVANAEYPMLSRLSFAADNGGREDPLFAYEIARLDLSRTRLVVLAACSTAVGPAARGEGVVNIARPFLAAGVPLVIASQWDVDDRATTRLSVALHRALAESPDPIRALQQAQLALLKSGDAALQSPSAWAAFVALGKPIS